MRADLTQKHSTNVQELERDLSQLKVTRDMALAEVEELSASKKYVISILDVIFC